MDHEAARGLTTRLERVQYIARLMASGEWISRKRPGKMQRRELAEMWGLAEATVRDMSAEAHRYLALDPGDLDELRYDAHQKMLGLYEEARSTPNMLTGQIDVRAALEALERALKYAGADEMQTGAMTPPKIEIVLGPPDAEDRPEQVQGSEESV